VFGLGLGAVWAGTALLGLGNVLWHLCAAQPGQLEMPAVSLEPGTPTQPLHLPVVFPLSPTLTHAIPAATGLPRLGCEQAAP
jgi:hypothetical protein